ncbi:hypothetical protein TgHK011_003550 [Trichoderma gracile]|nr:hypothetical protein TgHK011_003550 [Trichoderma gracile]
MQIAAASAPSPEEAHLYYYDGISPGPKLIARTSTNEWELSARISLPVTNETHPNLLRTFFSPDPNDKRVILMDQILDVLSEQRLRAMTILHYTTRNDAEWQTVLAITVEPGTLKFREAHAFATQLKIMMGARNLLDVECEIREEVSPTVAQAWGDVALAYIDGIDNIEKWM